MYKKYLTWVSYALLKIGLKRVNRCKIALILLTLCCSFIVQAQALKDQIIDISFKNQSLESALKTLEGKVKVRFVFNDHLINRPQPVNGSYQGSFQTVVEKMLAPYALDYEFVDNQYVVLKSRRETESHAQPADTVAPRGQQGFLQSGQVVDEHNQPIPGVSVAVRNASNSVVTDDKGRFNIGITNDGHVLVFRYLGYKLREQASNRHADLNIRLQPDPARLDEVTVIGYGTTTKRLATGTSSTVTSEQITNTPATNLASALQGRMAGVHISQDNGLPGSPMNFTIRGTNSISTSGSTINRNAPLFIVDGVPFMADAINAQVGNASLNGANGSASPLNTINPMDIERVDILKDADATAIYGSRGANGVVLITTKRGEAGKTQLDAMVRHGVSEVSHFVPTLNTEQYLAMRSKAFENSNMTPSESNAWDLVLWEQTGYTDWQKMLIGNTAHTTDANLALSGGDRRTNFRISGTYHKQGNVFIGDQGYNRASANANIGHKSANDRFELNFSAIYSADKNDVSVLDQTAIAYEMPPNFPLYNADGSLYWTGALFAPSNPLAQLNQVTEHKASNLITNLALSYRIWDGLSFKTTLGYSKADVDQKRLNPLSASDPGRTNTSSSIFAYNVTDNYILEPQFTYDKRIAKGQLSTLLGGTWQYRDSRQPFYVLANDFAADNLMENIALASSVSISRASSQYKYASLFGRINYNWDSKYILNLNFRRDGSSRFAQNNRYGNFGSVGAAWVFSEEELVKNVSWLSFGKLRGSYGVVGNDQIGDYAYYDSYTSYSSVFNGVAILLPTRIANPDYKWEETKKLEAALDLGFLKDRISFSAAFYRNRSGNQLVNYTLSPQTGFTSYQANFPALVQNKGWEFTLSSQNINARDFHWTSDFNISFNSNKLLEFPGIEGTSYYTSYIVGNPLNSSYLYQYTGVDESTGLPTFRDFDENGQITWGFSETERGDRYYVGTTQPKFFGGLSNTLRYKQLTLDFLLQFVKQDGRSILEASYYPPGYDPVNFAAEPMLEYLSAGLPSQPQATASSGAARTAWSNYISSDAMVVDASFIRLKNVSLSYDFKGRWLEHLKFRHLRLQVQAHNLFTITDYLGFDPESQGLSLPPLRTIVGAVQFTF